MMYLIQASRSEREEMEPVERQLREWECVSFTLLQYRHPNFFDPKFIEDEVIPLINSERIEGKADQLFARLKGDKDQWEDMKEDIQHLSMKSGGRVQHLASTEKLKEYVEANRYVLESSD